MAANIEQRLKTERRRDLRKFGFSFGAGMAILTVVGLWKDFVWPVILSAACLSIFHLGSAFFRVELLPLTYTAVTSIGKILGRAMTVVVFSVVYYFIFTPLAVLLRLCHKDVIANNSRCPAWIAFPEKDNDPQRINRLF